MPCPISPRPTTPTCGVVHCIGLGRWSIDLEIGPDQGARAACSYTHTITTHHHNRQQSIHTHLLDLVRQVAAAVRRGHQRGAAPAGGGGGGGRVAREGEHRSRLCGGGCVKLVGMVCDLLGWAGAADAPAMTRRQGGRRIDSPAGSTRCRRAPLPMPPMEQER